MGGEVAREADEPELVGACRVNPRCEDHAAIRAAFWDVQSDPYGPMPGRDRFLVDRYREELPRGGRLHPPFELSRMRDE